METIEPIMNRLIGDDVLTERTVNVIGRGAGAAFTFPLVEDYGPKLMSRDR